MKKLKALTLLATLTLTMNTFASSVEYKEIVIINREHVVNLNLNKESVRCSALGYVGRELKIDVKALEWISFFDHSNPGESEPCMTAGMMSCGQVFTPIGGEEEESLLERFRSLGAIQSTLKQVVTEQLRLDHDNRTCNRSLQEKVEMIVDGQKFSHFRSGDLGEYPFEACLQATL